MSDINMHAIKFIAELFDHIYTSIYVQDGAILRERIRSEVYAYEWHRIAIRTEWKQNGQRYGQEVVLMPEDFENGTVVRNRIEQHIEKIKQHTVTTDSNHNSSKGRRVLLKK